MASTSTPWKIASGTTRAPGAIDHGAVVVVLLGHHGAIAGDLVVGLDILPDRGVKSVIQKIGLAGLFQNAAALFQDTDLVCANLEAAITTSDTPLVKTFRFNSPLNLGEYLIKNKVKVVTIANNHSIDYGKAGLKDTVANLAKYQVEAFGYGDNAQAALAPKIIELNGTRIAFVGAVCFPLEGYVYLPNSFDVGRWDAQLMKFQIQAARRQADIVVVSLHWGIEFSHYPTASQIEIGHYCIDQGADLVMGHHPHVLQGMEIYHHKPIFYSLGNFIFDQHYGPTTETVFAKVTIARKKINRIELTPVFINESVPERADEEKATTIRSNFIKYSEPFGLTDSTFKNFELTDFE